MAHPYAWIVTIGFPVQRVHGRDEVMINRWTKNKALSPRDFVSNSGWA